MATIASLATEFNAQPYEVAAFADLGNLAQDAELSADTESMIREAWVTTPGTQGWTPAPVDSGHNKSI